MSKRFFAKESLVAGSYLRIILGLEDSESKHVTTIVKSDNHVYINYTSKSEVYVPDEFPELFEAMKTAYEGEVAGKITVAMIIELYDCMLMEFEFGSLAL